MDKALTRFAYLLDPDPALSPAEEQQRASMQLPGIVSCSAMYWLNGPNSTNGTGDKLVVGVAVWSRYDLELLDELNQFAKSNPDVQVSVFDVDKVGGEFDRYVPGIGEVLQTPVVGHWVGGVLTEKGTGHVGRQIAKSLILAIANPVK